MLEAKQIHFSHKPDHEPVLRGVSIRIGAGEIVGLFGPSGSGKTTLARVLAGYLPPGSGGVYLDGKPLPRRGICPIQLLFQHPELSVNPRWRIGRILAEGPFPPGHLMDALQIHRSWFGRYPHELSGGQIQRICVARALSPQTRFLIADEMTSMLDAMTQAQIWSVVKQRAKEQQIGILAISHNRPLLERICDRIENGLSPGAT